MDIRVYLLAISSITVGLVELIVGGVLPIIATDLNISVSTAGQMITAFAIVYAIAGPVLLSLTGKIERKKLFLITLIIFAIGNLITYFSTTFTLMMIARVITAMSAALIINLALTIVKRIVLPTYRARAFGIIYMGISSSLVLGVPVGIFITNLYGWRAVFLVITLLTAVTFVLNYFLLEKIPATESYSIADQIKALRHQKIILAHLATAFMLAGHYTLYAYFNPFLQTELHISENGVSVFYFLFGLAAMGGGAFGGWLATKIGNRNSILTVLLAFAFAIFILKYITFSVILFTIVMIIWGALSWSLSPPQQDYIINTDPEFSDLHQSINNSAIQLGIAIGSAIGGVVINLTNDVAATTFFGALVVLLGFVCAYISLKMPSPN